MSFFGSESQGSSRQRRPSASRDLATSNLPRKTTAPQRASPSNWQNRMASFKADVGGLTRPSVYKPHSPPSSPPPDEWDADNNNKSKSPQEKLDIIVHIFGTHHSEEGITKCICNRSFTEITCVSCGMMFEGRVRTPCARHPNTIHLMDMDRCPVCRASNLHEMDTMTPTAVPTVKSGAMTQSRPH